MMNTRAQIIKNTRLYKARPAAAALFALLLTGCMSTETPTEQIAEANQSEAEATQTATEQSSADSSGDSGSAGASANAEEQVKQLEQQLASMKVEWDQQKPALERLVSTEADLQFLVQALADMSQLEDEPSRDQYLGTTELSPEKRKESLQALQSLVTSQEELNTLLVDLTEVVAEVASRSEHTGSGTTAAVESTQNGVTNEMTPDTQGGTSTQTSDGTATGTNYVQSSVQSEQNMTSPDGSSGTELYSSSVQSSSSGYTKTSVSENQSSCDCGPAESSASGSSSNPAQRKDSSWFATTTPYAEATPAGSVTPVSQLDGDAASGQPIPGLQVKTFKRRTLPSELAAAGADMQQYAMAPQFHMSRKSLSDYVSQLAFKLAGNQQLAGNKIGVASFVFFDEQLEKTSAVGNQLAEELSTVLPNYGARVIEYKLTREITVGPTGDLSLSRNTRKLRDSQGMDYVLTGTMVPTRRGLQIHSRVVSTRDNVVIASASTLIPAMVLQQL